MTDMGGRDDQRDHVTEHQLGGDSTPAPAHPPRKPRSPQLLLPVIGDPRWMPLDGLPPGGKRAACEGGERPCRYVKCRMHLWRADANDSVGPHRADRPLPETTLLPRWLENPMPPSCALDVADRVAEGTQLEYATIGARLDRTRDWAQRVTRRAMKRLKRAVRAQVGEP